MIRAELAPSSFDRWVDVEEAAKFWSVEREYLQRKWKRFPFAKKISHKVVRFYLRDMHRWTQS